MSATYPNFPEYKLKNVYKGKRPLKEGQPATIFFTKNLKNGNGFFAVENTRHQQEKTLLYFMYAHGLNHTTSPISGKNKASDKSI
ncbi:hypothetical protein QKW52_23005 [Bacillus sonorensis]|nr:hypothetical protein [Bacillus sonorensis]